MKETIPPPTEISILVKTGSEARLAAVPPQMGPVVRGAKG